MTKASEADPRGSRDRHRPDGGLRFGHRLRTCEAENLGEFWGRAQGAQEKDSRRHPRDERTLPEPVDRWVAADPGGKACVPVGQETVLSR